MSNAGQPTKYKPEYCDLAHNYCLLGATDKELAGFFDVCEATLNNWKHDFPEFLESIKSAKEDADALVAKSLFQRATGYSCKETKIASFNGEITDTLDIDKHYPPDVKAGQFWLKNRQPKKWRDKPDPAEQENQDNQVEGFEMVAPE
jgi:hypothetical protein